MVFGKYNNYILYRCIGVPIVYPDYLNIHLIRNGIVSIRKKIRNDLIQLKVAIRAVDMKFEPDVNLRRIEAMTNKYIERTMRVRSEPWDKDKVVDRAMNVISKMESVCDINGPFIKEDIAREMYALNCVFNRVVNY